MQTPLKCASVLAVLGCSFVGGAAPTRAAGQAVAAPGVTFTRDVAPILQRSCQTCHRPGSLGPISFLTYEETRPWARAMEQKTLLREGGEPVECYVGRPCSC